MKQNVFCPLCKNNFQTRKYKFNLILYLIILFIGTVVFLYLGKFYSQIFFSLFPLMIISEYGKRLSTRFSISCPHCGFDMVTYKKDKKKTVLKVNNFYKTKKNSYNKLLKLGL